MVTTCDVQCVNQSSVPTFIYNIILAYKQERTTLSWHHIYEEQKNVPFVYNNGTNSNSKIN